MSVATLTPATVAGLTIDATDDGRVRLASADGVTFMQPATAALYASLLEGQIDDESRAMAAAMRRAVEATS